MINSVRNTVLAIANKNNYGYITPQDFNLYAKQAQMEFFDEYFTNYNKIVNMENARQSGTSYANMRKKQEENMEVFSTTKPLTNISNGKYSLPSLITTGDEAYMMNRVVCYTQLFSQGTNDTLVANELVDTTATFITDGVTIGDIVVNESTGAVTEVALVVSQTALQLALDIFTATGDDYAIFSASAVQEAEKINLSKITMLRNSLLTAPNVYFPAYTQEDGILTIYPSVISRKGQVFAQYFRFPKDPKWTYTTLANGEPVFDQSQPDYQDFELALEDEYKLIVKILAYVGIEIREADVVGFALGQEQHEQPSFSQKI